jgi:hypothetical protein
VSDDAEDQRVKAGAIKFLEDEEQRGTREYAQKLSNDDLLDAYCEYCAEYEYSGAGYSRIIRPRMTNYRTEILERMKR